MNQLSMKRHRQQVKLVHTTTLKTSVHWKAWLHFLASVCCGGRGRTCDEFFLEGCEQQQRGVRSRRSVSSLGWAFAERWSLSHGHRQYSHLELGHRAYDQNVYNYFKQILNLSNEQYEKTSLSLGEDVDKGITNKGLITRIFVELQIKENNPINKKTKQTKVGIYRAQLH